MKAAGGWLAAAAIGLFASPAFAAPAVTVSYVEGTALHVSGGRQPTAAVPTADAPWRRVTRGTKLAVNDTLRTGARGRLELTFKDGSRVRLAPNTTMTLTRATFEGQRRHVGVHVWLGRLWANVAKRLGSSSAFEVRTKNAVAGVRGTSFAVLAQADLSSIVKVYTGTVGVKKNGSAKVRTKRVQVAGPERIDRRQWEEVIATSMHQVRITQVGEIQPAEDFVDSGPDEAWAQWNQARDQRPQGSPVR